MRKLRRKDINLLAQRHSENFKKNNKYLAPLRKGVFTPLYVVIFGRLRYCHIHVQTKQIDT